MGCFVIFFRAWIVFGHVPIKRVAALVSGWCLVDRTLMCERRRSSFVFLASIGGGKGGGIPLMFEGRRGSFFFLASIGGGIPLMFEGRRSSFFFLANNGGLSCSVLRWWR